MRAVCIKTSDRAGKMCTALLGNHTDRWTFTLSENFRNAMVMIHSVILHYSSLNLCPPFVLSTEPVSTAVS